MTHRVSSLEITSTIHTNQIKRTNQRLDELVDQVLSSESNAELALAVADQATADLHLIREDLSRNLNLSPVPSSGVTSVASSHASASTDVLPQRNLFSELATASPGYGARVLFGAVSEVISIVSSRLTRMKDSPVDQLFLENNRSSSSSLVSSPSPSPRFLRDNIDVDFPPISFATPNTSSDGLSRVGLVDRGKSTANGSLIRSQHLGAQSAHTDLHPGPSHTAEQGGSLRVATNGPEYLEEAVSYTSSTSPSYHPHTQRFLTVEGSPNQEATDLSSPSSEFNSHDDFATTESPSTSTSPLILPHVALPVAPPLASVFQPLLPNGVSLNSDPSLSPSSSGRRVPVTSSDTQPNKHPLETSDMQPNGQPLEVDATQPSPEVDGELILQLSSPTWPGFWSYVTVFCLRHCQSVRASVCHTIL
jgi:hypothetical protein